MQAIAACGSRGQEKRAARDCKRPKSREETPKEGGSNTTKSRYRTAIICHCVAQKARGKSQLTPCAIPPYPINGARNDGGRFRGIRRRASRRVRQRDPAVLSDLAQRR